MKIKRIKVVRAFKKEYIPKSPEEQGIGKIYDALSMVIELNIQSFSYFTIQEEEDSPHIENILNFEILDSTIPKNWGIYCDLNHDNMFHSMTLEPKTWHDYASGRGEYGFWEDFHDDEYAAVNLYLKELAFIKGEKYVHLPKSKPDAKELLEIYRRKERDKCLKEGKVFDERKYPEPMAITCTDEW